MIKVVPKVSVGIPVYNGAEYIADAIESVLNQTFVNFELIISDNASTDNTAEICDRYVRIDERVRFVRQNKNLGAHNNFKFVLRESIGDYFMWAAVDDIRSIDFIGENVDFLESNPDFVSSCSVAKLVNGAINDDLMGSWELDQQRFSERLIHFFSTWHCNAHFYGVHRSNLAKKWVGFSDGFTPYLGVDWGFVVHMLEQGKVHSCKNGSIVLGAAGECRSTNMYAAFCKGFFDNNFPFKVNSVDAFKKLILSRDWTLSEVLKLSENLFDYNRKGARHKKLIEKYEYDFNLLVNHIVRDGYPEVVICGAGDVGAWAATACINNKVKINCFTDKSAVGTQVKILGNKYDVNSLVDALEKGNKVYVIASYVYSEQIFSELTALSSNYEDIKIYSLLEHT